MFSTRSSKGIGLYTISWTSHTSPWTHWKSANTHTHTRESPHVSRPGPTVHVFQVSPPRLCFPCHGRHVVTREMTHRRPSGSLPAHASPRRPWDTLRQTSLPPSAG